MPQEKFGDVVARISFFVNAGVRFVEEMCKLRAFGQLWDEITRERYGVENPKQRRFRYGVQVNSLGLTEAQPENNVYRILLEMLAVTMSKDARARAVQLPAWNEALGLPRAWDQQWSLRMQQVLAYESDLLEYEDLFDGSHVVEAKVAEIKDGARAEIDKILDMGGAVAAVESGYLKSELVSSLARRRRRIEAGEDVVVGVNAYTETEPNPLQGGEDGGILTVDPDVERSAIEAIEQWRARAGRRRGRRGAAGLRDAAKTDANLMAASLACARAGVTVGEWADELREVFGEFRAADRGLRGQRRRAEADPGRRAGAGAGARRRARAAAEVPRRQARARRSLQRRRADRRAGPRRRLRGRLLRHPADARADRVGRGRGGRRRGRAVDPVRLAPVRVPAVLHGLQRRGWTTCPVVAGGIIPEQDAATLREQGVARVFTPEGLRDHRRAGRDRRRDRGGPPLTTAGTACPPRQSGRAAGPVAAAPAGRRPPGRGARPGDRDPRAPGPRRGRALGGDRRAAMGRVSIEVTRELLITPDDDDGASGTWTVRFADRRPFHPWTPGLEVVHPCRADTYRGLVLVDRDATRLRTLWDVTGPAKDQRLLTRCLRSRSPAP